METRLEPDGMLRLPLGRPAWKTGRTRSGDKRRDFKKEETRVEECRLSTTKVLFLGFDKSRPV